MTRARNIAAGVVLVVVTALATLPIEDSFSRTSQQPPGCAERDQNVPGCRKTGQTRLSQNAVALATVILTPLGAFATVLITVNAAARRQEEELEDARTRQRQALNAEQTRLTTQLAHERELAGSYWTTPPRSRGRCSIAARSCSRGWAAGRPPTMSTTFLPRQRTNGTMRTRRSGQSSGCTLAC